MTAWVRWFEQPWALWLLLALPALGLLQVWARWRRQRSLRELGSPALVGRLLLLDNRRRRWSAILLFLGILAAIVGLAGPRWGVEEQPELLAGKDLVIALDLSKSMLAEQPSRLERARRSLHNFADMLEARGGHRVALVVFAAHARLQFPLTNDYDHFRNVLDQLEPNDLPPQLRPRPDDLPASGTRIGAALRLAASAHRAGRIGRQDIILVSDGDDPAGDDEWVAGVTMARQLGIPIHVVAVGDPRQGHSIPQKGNVLRHDGKVVSSTLNETLLQEIARRTQGIYLPAHLTYLPLGRLMRGYLDGPSRTNLRDSDGAETRLQSGQARYAWFLLPAVMLFGATMLFGDGVGSRNQVRKGKRWRWAFTVLALAAVSAEPLDAVEEYVRQGNAAFARQEFENALQWYDKAATDTTDPGLVAFNQGATLFRLQRYDEAAAHYRRCLEDQLILPARQTRASYDLGNALLQASPQDQDRLEQAIAAYRLCLENKPPANLYADVEHNLELAKWLWLKARPASKGATPNTPDPKPRKANNQGTSDPSLVQKSGTESPEDGQRGKPGVGDPGHAAAKKQLSHGPLQVLPDANRLIPLTPDETAAHLDQHAERIRRERSSYWQQIQPIPSVKDW